MDTCLSIIGLDLSRATMHMIRFYPGAIANDDDVMVTRLLKLFNAVAGVPETLRTNAAQAICLLLLLFHSFAHWNLKL